MQPFTRVASRAVALDIDNIDTDQIIPARFMSRPRAEGYGDFLLHDLRKDSEGRARPDFPLNDPAHRGAELLVAGRNFGTGSSREAAVYALWDAGFRAVIAPGFGDIFASSAVKNGLLPARVSEADKARLVAVLTADAGTVLTVDLTDKNIAWPEGSIGFEIAEGARQQLLNGWDDIDLTLRHAATIQAWAAADASRRPWAAPAPDRGAPVVEARP
jgi:3-isopropylmalate/(R)-2-methylmalate dehydratase small subunit